MSANAAAADLSTLSYPDDEDCAAAPAEMLVSSPQVSDPTASALARAIGTSSLRGVSAPPMTATEAIHSRSVSPAHAMDTLFMRSVRAEAEKRAVSVGRPPLPKRSVPWTRLRLRVSASLTSRLQWKSQTAQPSRNRPRSRPAPRLLSRPLLRADECHIVVTALHSLGAVPRPYIPL